jgi:very-short-patch-repair endonuclease/biotin operon repressor
MRRLNLDIDDLVAAHKAGESVKSIAERLGCSRTVVVDRLQKAGVTPHSRSEAMRLRQAALSPEERLALASKAHEAVRGRVHPEEEKIRRAKTRFKKQLGVSPYARELRDALQKLGRRVELEWPLGPYNLDIALDRPPIAVELHGGGWHSVGRHARRRAERIEYLRGCGWSVIEVWQIKAGWDSLAVSYQIQAISKLIGPNPPAIGEHWMLRCDGELAPALRSYGHDVAAVDSASRRDDATGRYRRVT